MKGGKPEEGRRDGRRVGRFRKGQKVKRSKVTFDFLQYEQMEDNIPKGLMRDAIINNKPLYNERARTIIIYIESSIIIINSILLQKN